MDLLTLLHQTKLFSRCNASQLGAIAGICVEHHLPQDALVCRQSYLGTTFYIIASGEALVRRINEKGEDRPVRMLTAGDAFGLTSLFLGEPRDASVIAASELHLYTITRDDFRQLLEAQPDLWRSLTIPSEVVVKLRAPTADWLEPDESLAYFCHRHWLVAARPIALTSLLYLALSILLFSMAASTGTFPSFWVPVTGLYLLLLIWFWLDWRNDYFAVTTRRIVHHERVLFLFEAREEAPIDRVQNVNIERGLAAAALRYGDLVIETAAVAGVLHFTRIPEPEAMREAIFEQANRMQAVSRAAHKLRIQDELAGRLGGQQAADLLMMPVPEKPFALADANALQLSRKGLAHVIEKLGSLGILPRTRLLTSDGIVWRKHWIFLILSSLFPFLCAGVCGAAVLIITLNPPLWIGDYAPYARAVSVALFMATFGWFFWQVNDWSNDLYIVTNDRIIDIERHPLFLSEARREASLGVIQNVSFRQNNLLAKVFNYGDVLIQTAGPGAFTFTHVPNPREVQREIFRRMEAFRRTLREREAASLRGEIGEWFGAYDEMQTSHKGA